MFHQGRYLDELHSLSARRELGLKKLDEVVVKDYFSKTGAVWWNPRHVLYDKQINDIIRFVNPNDKVILDAGVGKGRLAIPLALWGAQKVIGIDISPKMLRITKKRAKKARVIDKIILELGDIEHLSYRNETFDVVCCLETLVHLPNPQKAMNELARVVKYAGLVIADADFAYRPKTGKFDNLRSVLGEIYLAKPLYPLRIIGFRFFDKPLIKTPRQGIYRTINKNKFKKYFRDANLKIEKVIEYNNKRISGFIVVYAKR